MGNLLLASWQQQAAIERAVAKGQQLYLSAEGQVVGLPHEQLDRLATAVSPYTFVNALPLTLAEARPWANFRLYAHQLRPRHLL